MNYVWTNLKSTPQVRIWRIKFFFSQFKISCAKKIVVGGINGLSINKDFDEVQQISKFGPMDMPPGSTFEISTQIILLQIDGFLQKLDLKYHPS